MRVGVDGVVIRGSGYTPHVCEFCNEDFVGRRNAKFCSTKCKNHFNNNRTRFRDGVLRKYYTIIETNYRILNDLLETGKSEITHVELIRVGFQSKYFTSIESFRVGDDSFKCNVICDLALIPISNDKYQIFKHETN